MTAKATRIHPDGTITCLTADAAKIVRVLCLNSPKWKRWRRIWIRILELAKEGDQELLRELLGFPVDLPNLKLCRAPRNARPAGVSNCFFARRERGDLPGIFLG